MYILLSSIFGYFIIGFVVRYLLNSASRRRNGSDAYEDLGFCLLGWPVVVLLLSLIFWIDLMIDFTKLLLKMLRR